MRAKKRNKKILSLLIATLMIISMLPSSVFAATDDVMIEEYADVVTEEADVVTEEADVVDGVADEAAEVPDVAEQEVEADLAGASEIVSATAEGLLSGGKMTFDAVLDGVSVSAAVPASRAPQGSVMTVDLVDVADYADAIAAKIYGKDVSALKGLELHFYNKKGKEITHINTSDVTITADAMDADSYALCRLNGNSVGVVKKADASAFTFKEKKAYTYAIVGLVDDGVLRATAETGSNGVKTFNLDNIEVIAPEDAFGDDVAMEASDVTGDAATEEEALVGSSEDEVIAAYEISFYDEDGVEQQPEKEVTVKIATALDMSKNYKLIHIADNGETNEVENAVFTENGVEFVAESFSVYAIVDDGSTATGEQRCTYEFLNADGTPYTFTNTAGNIVHNQILKNGEILEEVGIPEIDASEEAFLGWYYWDGSSYGDPVVFNQPMTVTETKTVYIRANVGSVHYLTFYEDAPGGTILTRVQVPSNTTYDISQHTLPAPEAGLVFVGWSTDPGENEDSRTPITETSVTVNADEEYYPVFKSAHWLTFVSAKMGSGAKYIAPQYVLYGDTTQTPETPTWTGYTFSYWSTTPHVYDEEGNITNDGSAGRFTFGSELTQDTTLYAYWENADTNYTIIYWKQNITDAKNAADNAKTYSYFTMESATGKAHETATIPTSATNKATTDTANFLGFVYNANKSDTSITVDPKGSSIMNVYYDRELVTMQFYANGTSAPTNGYSSNVWTNGSQYVTTFTGLYGQTLAQNGYSWPTDGHYSYYDNDNSATGMTYLGQFVLPTDTRNNSHTLIRMYRDTNGTNYTVSFYLENVDGTYPNTASATGGGNGTFKFSDKYDGFDVFQYRRLYKNGTAAESWKTARVGNSVTMSYGSGWSTNYYNLEIRYARKSYTLHYLDSVDNSKVLADVTVKYGASLTTYKPSDGTTPSSSHPGKEFDGKWYADAACTQEFDFANSVMPNGDINVYAGWKDIWYWIKVDPNGGEIPQNTGATWFWETYGEQVEEYGFVQRDYIEDENGTYYYHYDEFNNDDPNGTQPSDRLAYYTTDASLSSDGGKKYSYSDDAYKLIGWFEVDKETDEVLRPYNFGAGVTDNVIIRAMWRRVGEYKLDYIATSEDGIVGTLPPVDSNGYADQSNTSILGNPVPPTGYVFSGWKYDGKIYNPGDIVVIKADLADSETKKIPVTAVYTKYEDIPVGVTHINWYGNKYDIAGRDIPGINSAQEFSKQSDDVPYNEEIEIANISDLNVGDAYDGYTFLGWAKKDVTDTSDPKFTENDLFLKYESGKYYAKDNNNEWVEAKAVGADETQPYQDLYAVWQTEFYVYHSGVANDGNLETVIMNKTNMPDGTYDLTQHLTDNTLYGGYYLEGGFTMAEGKAAYDGDNWIWTNPETVNGKSITPEPGQTYYIKEVPADKFLKPYTHYTYRLGTMKLTKIWLITDIDDCYYSQVGFQIVKENKVANVCKSLTVKNANGGTSVKLTASNVFAAKGATATDYLGYHASDTLMNKGDILVRQYWVTPDGLMVTGTTERQINFGDKTVKPDTGIVCSDESSNSSISTIS